ncbi:6-phosphofructokinase [Kytococcus sedentarius]|uniref:6-phosphofructokinase n=1 Tax=Kytococcus sedentarius TaxID=1276 RepID=UPI0035BBFB79
MRIGILTSGGDCPGLNAVIRGAVLKGDRIHGHEFLGIKDGWRGLVEDDVAPLPRHQIRGLSKQGGTILGTSRVGPYGEGNGGAERVRQTMERHGMDALIAIGGEGTLTVARMLHDEGIDVVGVPKTIDNDLSATDYTFGFDTAVHVATEAIDRLRTTGESHHRCMVLEVMGRHAGWIALHAGVAGGAHAILVPEVPVGYDQVAEWVEATMERGRAPLVVVAEGFMPDGEIVSGGEVDGMGRPRLGGVGEQVAHEIEARTGIESRAMALGHMQRGGSPTAYDRVLATRFGTAALDAVHDRAYGQMVALAGTEIVRVPLAEATTELKSVPRERWDEAAILFG